MSDSSAVLPYFYFPRSGREAHREFLEDHPVGCSNGTWASWINAEIAKGKLIRGKDGLISRRHPIHSYQEVLSALGKLFAKENENPFDYSPVAWYLEYIFDEKNEEKFLERLKQTVAATDFLTCCRLVTDLLENPKATIHAMNLWFDAEDPMGSRRRGTLEDIRQYRAGK